MLRVILNNQNKSLYQLEKSSNVSHATLNDIYNEKSNIDNCSILVMSKIAHSLDMNIEELYAKLAYKDLSLFTYNEEFDLFKSNTLQQLKNTNEVDYINIIIRDRLIDTFYKNSKYLEALYLLSLVDYLCSQNNIPLFKEYEYLRERKLNKIVVPKSLYLLLVTKQITATEIYKESIPEFLKHNIIESEIGSAI